MSAANRTPRNAPVLAGLNLAVFTTIDQTTVALPAPTIEVRPVLTRDGIPWAVNTNLPAVAGLLGGALELGAIEERVR